MDDLYTNMISRQSNIFTNEEQEKLRKTPLVVVGCGGLGGTVIEQLVRSGFEQLTIIDEDVFDKSNLNRQIMSNLECVGKSKSEITKENIIKINPNLCIKSFNIKLDENNVSEILGGNEIVIDAVDNVYTRVLISREARKQNMLFVHSAVEETTGQLSIFEPDSVSYEELFRLKSVNKPLSDMEDYLLGLSEKKPQVLGVTPAIFACLQVSETIKYILGKDDVVLAPNVLLWDISDFSSFRVIDF